MFGIGNKEPKSAEEKKRDDRTKEAKVQRKENKAEKEKIRNEKSKIKNEKMKADNKIRETGRPRYGIVIGVLHQKGSAPERDSKGRFVSTEKHHNQKKNRKR